MSMRPYVVIAALASAAVARAQGPAPGRPSGTAAPGAVPSLPPTPAPPVGSRVLTLGDALRTAREHQPQLQSARAGTAAAAARSRQAFSALLPQVVASGSYQRTTSNFAPRPGLLPSSIGQNANTSWSTSDYWTFGATASELVYDFGQTTGRWHASEASAAAQRDTERFTLLQVTLGVRTAYFNARANKDLVTVARDNLANLDAHLRQIEGFVRAGTRPEIDLAQARTDRANGEVQLITADNNYATSKALLNQAMGVEGGSDFDVADETLPPVQGEDQPLDALFADALKARPDIASLEQQARSQELTIGAVRGAYAPALGVSTTLSDSGPALDSTVWNWNAAATLTWNLFQGGLTSAQEQEARANLDAARAQIETQRQQVRVDVEQSRLAVKAAKSALVAAGAALANAQVRLRLAEGRYQAGVGSVIELGDSQVALTTAAAQRVQAQYNLSSSRAQLLRALGREGEVSAK